MSTATSSPMLKVNSTAMEIDNLHYEIFSILENKFLFGYEETYAKKLMSKQTATATPMQEMRLSKGDLGKVRILCIDGNGATDGILAAKSLVYLEACLRRKSGNPSAHISAYFDVVAGSGIGGILAALLFTRGRDGGPLFTADKALQFLVHNRRKIFKTTPVGVIRRLLRPAKLEKLLTKTYGESTLKDTLKSVLIPCYDLTTQAPVLFSRADAVEMDGYDFKMSDVCAATSASAGPIEVKSIDGRTKITAVGGNIAMNNPTAAAITHVLNNKHEFPFCNGVEDLLVLSLGNGEAQINGGKAELSPAKCLRIAGEGAADMVDQAISMAFGPCGSSNYVRIQANNIIVSNSNKYVSSDLMAITEDMLAQKNVESVLFQGKRMVQHTNLDKLELFSGEILKEQGRRKASILPTVVLKQNSPSPRTSSATTLSTQSSSCYISSQND